MAKVFSPRPKPRGKDVVSAAVAQGASVSLKTGVIVGTVLAIPPAPIMARHRRDRGGCAVSGSAICKRIWVGVQVPSEVGTVPAEHVAPLLARTLDGFGDEVRDVSLPSPCHPDVRRRGSAVLADQHDEWAIARRYLSDTSMAELTEARDTPSDQPAIEG